MQKITTANELKIAILQLEIQQAEEYILLKEQLQYTSECLRPINIIKSALKEMYTSPELKTNIITSAFGMATGFVAKKVFLGKTNNPFSKLLGFLVEMLVANKVAKNGDRIKSIGGSILRRFVNKDNETSSL